MPDPVRLQAAGHFRCGRSQFSDSKASAYANSRNPTIVRSAGAKTLPNDGLVNRDLFYVTKPALRVVQLSWTTSAPAAGRPRASARWSTLGGPSRDPWSVHAEQ